MEAFRIQNIKSFKDSGEIKIKPITILVGKNSCGKSSLLRFPAVLAQTAKFDEKKPISFFGDYVDYGNFEDVVYGKTGKELSFSISYNLDISCNTRIVSDYGGIRVAIRSKGETNFHKVTITVKLCRNDKSIKVNGVFTEIDEKPLSKLFWDEKTGIFVLKLLAFYDGKNLKEITEEIFFEKDEVEFEKFFPIYNGDSIKAIVRTKNLGISENRQTEIFKYCYLSSRGIKDKIELNKEELDIAQIYMYFNYSFDIMRNIYELFNAESRNRISYIGPFRQNPGRIYRNSEANKIHVGTRGENVGDILVGAYQKSEISPLFKEISTWLNKYFGYRLTIQELGNNYFQLMLQQDNGLLSNIIDVGFGISQVLPIISEICLTSKLKKKSKTDYGINSIVLIEQPELHLHPAAQASLAELFATCVTLNPNARLIIETHSEHLISKLQVLIADEANSLTNEMVQILYVDKKDGETTIDKMVIKENGKFEKIWPEGFFDQGYNLAVELMLKASQKERNN